MQHRSSTHRLYFLNKQAVRFQREAARSMELPGIQAELHYTSSRPDAARMLRISGKLHHTCMSENQTSVTEATVNSGKWIGQLVAAVILAEGIWGFLASLTNNLVLPLLAREMGSDPQSPLYLGKGEFDFPALFKSVLALCLAGIVFVLLHEWSRKRRSPVRVKTVRVTEKVSPPSAAQSSGMAASDALSAPQQTPVNAFATPAISPVALQQKSASAPVASSKRTKPQTNKPVYYNIVGEPVNPTEND